MIQEIKNIRNNYLTWLRKRRQDKKYHSLIGRYIISDQEANNAIYQKIIENKPCFISRFGSTELSTLLYYKQERLIGNKWQAYYHILCAQLTLDLLTYTGR